jgi:hypothetical protein
MILRKPGGSRFMDPAYNKHDKETKWPRRVLAHP